jgi:glucokinase
MTKTILSGDIGGTNTRLMLANVNQSNKTLTIIHQKSYKNKEFPEFKQIITKFLAEHKSPVKNRLVDAACFAVAGPIIDQSVKLTNLPWKISAKNLKKELSLPATLLINDFSAIGYAIPYLNDKDRITLQPAKKQSNAPIAFLGAGTGLGVGLMTPTEKQKYLVLQTEGGHVDFAPTNAIQQKILAFLSKKYHRVSVERVLSGHGLANIYEYLQQDPPYGIPENPELLHKIETTGSKDPAQIISQFALEKKDILAQIALDEFCKIYGAFCGNIGLSTLCYGGLYIAGGIAPKILPIIQKSDFIRKFKDKGRMSNLLDAIPLFLITDPDIGLKGSCWAALSIS